MKKGDREFRSNGGGRGELAVREYRYKLDGRLFNGGLFPRSNPVSSQMGSLNKLPSLNKITSLNKIHSLYKLRIGYQLPIDWVAYLSYLSYLRYIAYLDYIA